MKEFKKQMYIIIDKGGYPNVNTLEHLKKDCINRFIDRSNYTWEQVEKLGWKCEKVEVIIRETK